MRLFKRLTKLLFIVVLALSASSMVSAKVASGFLFAQQAVLDAQARTVVYGGDFKDNLISSTVDQSAARAFNFIGHQLYKNNEYKGMPLPPKTVTHALVGGVFARIKGGDFNSGAIATAAGHVTAEYVKARIIEDFDPANPPFDINDKAAIDGYTNKINAQIVAVGNAVGGAAAIISTENINDDGLAAAQAVSHSVIESNALCGGLCVTGVILAVSSAYTAWTGDGDLSEGLETLGKGDDPLSQAIASGTEKAIALSAENYPEATMATLQILGELGDSMDAAVEYVDDATGNIVSTRWNELDEATRDQLVGAGKVVSVSLSALSVTKIAAIKRKMPGQELGPGEGRTPQEVVAERDVTKSVKRFKHGDLFEHTINTKKGPVDFLAETIVKGDTLILKDVAVFGRKGNEALTGLQKDIFRGAAQLKDFAREQGFKRLEIQGTRVPTSSSGRPGHDVNLGWNL